MSHAAMLSAPSGGSPIAKDTEHCGQKLMRGAADFCRGFTPTVCANMYTATDFCPGSISRLQRRQRRFCKCAFRAASCHPIVEILSSSAGRKCAERFRRTRAKTRKHQAAGIMAEPHFALARPSAIVHSAGMSAGDSRPMANWSRGPTEPASAKVLRLSHLRRLKSCEQVAAVCYRMRSGGIEFLLVQTRGGRWTFPKGSAEPGLTHAQAAALEAFEEAGVHGRMEETSFACYVRRKRSGARRSAAKEITVNAHLCEVSRLDPPQEANRNRTWFSLEKAKRRLRQDRDPDYGAELARVVDRATARVRRIREWNPPAAAPPPKLRLLIGNR